MRILGAISIVIFAAAAAAAEADATEDYPLSGRHAVGLIAGLWHQSTGTQAEIRAGSVLVESDTGGGLGGVVYTYWLEESMALRIGIGGMAADVSARVDGGEVSSVTATIVPILFGLKYYFPSSTYGRRARPFGSGLVGAFIGTQTATEVGRTVSVESRTETAIGGQVGAGLEFVISRHFLATAAVGYNLMTDFGRFIGGSDNYSGAEFTFGFGYVI